MLKIHQLCVHDHIVLPCLPQGCDTEHNMKLQHLIFHRKLGLPTVQSFFLENVLTFILNFFAIFLQKLLKRLLLKIE